MGSQHILYVPNFALFLYNISISLCSLEEIFGSVSTVACRPRLIANVVLGFNVKLKGKCVKKINFAVK